ncbi:hypothetical protein B0J14DRAFT_311849 [Halenospora varia]|nr:hypothetical protein B0J14DRAFT_311849 [Halenospora varia]
MAQDHIPLNMNTLGPGPGPHPFAVQSRNPLEEFKQVVQECTRESVIHERSRPFILMNRLSEWYQRQSNDDPKNSNAGRLLRAVYRDNDPPNLIHQLLLAIEPGHRCWLKVFTILMDLGKGEYIGQFWDSGLLDRRLPIAEDVLYKELAHIWRWNSDENRDFARQFCHFQHRLCTIDLLDAEGGEYSNQKQSFPCVERSPSNQIPRRRSSRLRFPANVSPITYWRKYG